MREILRKIKSEQKQLAVSIRTAKDSRKSAPYGRVPGLDTARYEYRHRHVVYCLLRGRALDEIEKPSAENPRNEKLIMQYWLEYLGLPYPLKEVPCEEALRTRAG